MPSFTLAQKLNNIQTDGQYRKNISDMIAEASWNEDIQAKKAYLYDYYHDVEPTSLRGLTSSEDKGKVLVDVKYILNSTQTYDKDQITFHIQFRPSFNYKNIDGLSYFDTTYGVYKNIFPIGQYIDIPDESGQYNRWLIVDKANFYANQFPTFEILPCDHIFQYIIDNKKYQVAGCVRSQSSYTSGVYTDYKITSMDDVQKFIVPLNKETEKLYYNQRIIIDAPVETEPRTWTISKIDRLEPVGICKATLKQGEFNEHTDYIEKDDDGNVIGLWADYYKTSITPTDFDVEPTTIVSKVMLSFNGTKDEIRIGGGYKKITATFYKNDEETSFETNGVWEYTVNGEDASSLLNILDHSTSSDVEENQVKIKFIGDRTYHKKTLTINYTAPSGLTSSLDLQILAL